VLLAELLTQAPVPSVPVSEGPDPAWGLALGIPVIAGGAAASWAVLDLRGKMYTRWKLAVDIAHSGLAERITDSLRELRTAIDYLLPESATFDPASVVANPDKVEPQAKHSISLIKTRQQLYRRYQRLLRSCDVLKYLTIAFTSFGLLATVLYFAANDRTSLWWSAMIACAASGVAIILTAVVYGVLTSRLQRSVERADDASDASS